MVVATFPWQEMHRYGYTKKMYVYVHAWNKLLFTISILVKVVITSYIKEVPQITFVHYL